MKKQSDYGVKKIKENIKECQAINLFYIFMFCSFLGFVSCDICWPLKNVLIDTWFFS